MQIVTPGGTYYGAFAVPGLTAPDGMGDDPPQLPRVVLYRNGGPTDAEADCGPAESDQTDGLFSVAVGVPGDWLPGDTVQGRVRYSLGGLARVLYLPAVTLAGAAFAAATRA